MCTSQVQGGATNAAPQWTKKLGLPRIPDNKPPVSRTTGSHCLGLLQGFSESPCQKIK